VSASIVNVLSVDVEEYFHPSEVQPYLNGVDRRLLPSRVEKQTLEVLELFAQYGVTGTFFIVGTVAELQPQLVREIAAAGHEIGCHSYAHQLVYNMTPEQFRLDTRRCLNALGDATGVQVRAYRAPSYSITRKSLWALDVLADMGFTHDSSIYPIAHDRYGICGFNRHAQMIQTSSGPICEVPIASVEFANGRTAPVGGGAYLRLLPYRYTAAGIRRINTEGEPACVYFHPWELDSEQPHLAKGLIARLRTYSGLRSMAGKLNNLLNDFRFASMNVVHPVIASEEQQLHAIA
jgi:polysaccharide deacetylase family protein (PEP-CTERM system associated)